jgi:HlyD family secretion protein
VIKAGDPIFTLVAPETVWGLAYIDESRVGPVAEGQTAVVRLRSLPQQTFEAKVVRIGIESDRVNEERRVYVKCELCPPRFFLGEQAEVLITVAHLDQALLVPEAAVQGFDGTKGTVWTVENDRLRQRTLTFRYRTEDARLEVVDGLPDEAQIVAAIGPGFREGRWARVTAEAVK